MQANYRKLVQAVMAKPVMICITNSVIPMLAFNKVLEEILYVLHVYILFHQLRTRFSICWVSQRSGEQENIGGICAISHPTIDVWGPPSSYCASLSTICASLSSLINAPRIVEWSLLQQCQKYAAGCHNIKIFATHSLLIYVTTWRQQVGGESWRVSSPLWSQFALFLVYYSMHMPNYFDLRILLGSLPSELVVHTFIAMLLLDYSRSIT